jgi:hypothetical protein
MVEQTASKWIELCGNQITLELNGKGKGGGGRILFN